MFKKSKVIPERKPFCLTKEEISDDILAVCEAEEQANKLYHCLDDKPPYEHKFVKVEKFLQGTNNLEEVSEKLLGLIDEVQNLTKEVENGMDAIKELKKNMDNA